MIPTPEEITAARAALTDCDEQSAAGLREACDLLETWGDWLDVERARAVRRAFDLDSANAAAGDDLAFGDDEAEATAPLGAVVWVLLFAAVTAAGIFLALPALIGG